MLHPDETARRTRGHPGRLRLSDRLRRAGADRRGRAGHPRAPRPAAVRPRAGRRDARLAARLAAAVEAAFEHAPEPLAADALVAPAGRGAVRRRPGAGAAPSHRPRARSARARAFLDAETARVVQLVGAGGGDRPHAATSSRASSAPRSAPARIATRCCGASTAPPRCCGRRAGGGRRARQRASPTRRISRGCSRPPTACRPRATARSGRAPRPRPTPGAEPRAHHWRHRWQTLPGSARSARAPCCARSGARRSARAARSRRRRWCSSTSRPTPASPAARTSSASRRGRSRHRALRARPVRDGRGRPARARRPRGQAPAPAHAARHAGAGRPRARGPRHGRVGRARRWRAACRS